MSELDGAYINGRWHRTHDGTPFRVINPATEEAVASIRPAGTQEVEQAVTAATLAGGQWARTPPIERAAVLGRISEELEIRREQIALTISTDVGTPIRIAARVQVQLPITVLKSYADLLAQGCDDERIGNSLVVREPVGVVAAITPWNYPLHQIVCKLAPALAAGATLVLKPSEIAPMALYALIEALEAAGTPHGVVNVVHGTGPEVGQVLVGHPGVDMVSFTGSFAAGATVAELAARSVKRVTLELGGKSANLILQDADLAGAVKAGVNNAFLNAGQTCSAWTRMLVPQGRHDEAVEMAAAAAAGFTPGDPSDPATKLGPLVSAAQRTRVRGFIDRGIAEGAVLATGGSERPVEAPHGFYVRPTVFGGVDPDSTIAQEEIFGPVLAVIPYADEEEAVRIANNSRYGLHGAVWSADHERALAVARRLRTGSVDINGAPFNPLAPFGGYKHSGMGRELGRFGLEDYTQIKSIQT